MSKMVSTIKDFRGLGAVARTLREPPSEAVNELLARVMGGDSSGFTEGRLSRRHFQEFVNKATELRSETVAKLKASLTSLSASLKPLHDQLDYSEEREG